MLLEFNVMNKKITLLVSSILLLIVLCSVANNHKNYIVDPIGTYKQEGSFSYFLFEEDNTFRIYVDFYPKEPTGTYERVSENTFRLKGSDGSIHKVEIQEDQFYYDDDTYPYKFVGREVYRALPPE